jgi:hypothetical protein
MKTRGVVLRLRSSCLQERRARGSHARGRLCRVGVVAVVLLVLGLTMMSLADDEARADIEAPEFTLARDQGLVGNFGGFGGQLNQHVYADLSGPPPDLPGLESKVLALGPQFVRIFFNTTEWTLPDRMASFVRTVQLARRAQTEINITWQGSSFAFAMANMPRFADVLADLIDNGGVDRLWVTLFNEPNSTRQTLPQYEQVYRLLDSSLRDRGVRDRIHFMGGDLVGTTSPLGQSQADWFRYMASHMGDLLDAWSVHVYWDFWDAVKIDRRLLAEVRTIFSTIPAEQRRPLYVTEFGVRGLPTFEGEPNSQPGLWPEGTPMSATTADAFQEAWFMLRAAQLGYTATVKWDLYAAKYDLGTQDYSAIGPGADGWPLRPVYHVLQLLILTTEPRGGSIVSLVPSPGADPKKLLTAYISPGSGVTILGLDTDGGSITTASDAPVAYSVGGLPPNTLFRLLEWNADGSGTNLEIGFLDTGPAGMLQFSVPLHAVFALTNTSIGSVPK